MYNIFKNNLIFKSLILDDSYQNILYICLNNRILDTMNIRFLLILALALGILACENSLEDYQPGITGTDYFPLEVGNTWIYQLDSITYDNNGSKIDTTSIQVKETITEHFIDQEGNDAYRIARAWLKNDFWVTSDIWFASIDDKLAYRNEENLRFAKLSFPIKEGNTWDGNAFIDEEIIVKIAGEPIRVYQNWGDYLYISVDESENIGGDNYSSVCTVNQVDLEDKITRRFAEEKYAKGIGLVYKQMIVLNTQKFDSTDSWEVKAEEGFILEQTLISFQSGG